MELVDKVSVSLIQSNATDDMVAMAAWVSHDQDSEERLDNREQVKKLINFLYTNKHMSPFEHGQFTFKVDVPLFVAREFHRHRTFGYNEVSGRYTEMKPRFWIGDVARIQKGKPGDYYFEPGNKEQTDTYRESKKKAVKKAWRHYKKRLASGMAKEQAREDLPLSLMTQFYATVNPRNLMAFLTLRNDKHALKEIRLVAEQMEAIFKEQMPLTYAAYAAQREREQRPVITDTDLIAKITELELANKEFASREILLRAESDALGVKLLEVQQESIDNYRQATAWQDAFEEKKGQVRKLQEENKLLTLKLQELESAVTKPKDKFDIKVMVNDAMSDPMKVAEQVIKTLDNLEKRKPPRR